MFYGLEQIWGNGCYAVGQNGAADHIGTIWAFDSMADRDEWNNDDPGTASGGDWTRRIIPAKTARKFLKKGEADLVEVYGGVPGEVIKAREARLMYCD